jgi:hypothetical protein
MTALIGFALGFVAGCFLTWLFLKSLEVSSLDRE